MIVHELKNDVSTVRFHDEFFEIDSTHLIGSVSRVVSDFYKRRYLLEKREPLTVAKLPERQSMLITLQV